MDDKAGQVKLNYPHVANLQGKTSNKEKTNHNDHEQIIKSCWKMTSDCILGNCMCVKFKLIKLSLSFVTRDKPGALSTLSPNNLIR